MKIGFCQFEIKHKDVKHNLDTILTMLKETDAELVVLPELALTGYYFEDKQELMALSTDEINQKAITKLKQVAIEKAMIIVNGLGEVVGDDLYNTAYVINESGVVGKHRKIHLTNLESIFTPGDEVALIEVNGLKIGIAICFDTWFPELFRRLSDLGADLICCPANFGGPWTLDVIKVRALENAIPVILSNRLGCEIILGDKDYFRGESMVVDGYGNPLIRAYDQPYIGVVNVNIKSFNRNQSLISKNMVEEKNKYNNL